MESVYVTRTTNLIEYMKIHLISLKQDQDNVVNVEDSQHLYIAGQIKATNHLLSVASDILSNNIQGKGY
jgi:hypothetical protein